MKNYVVMIDYGTYEGWRIHGEADDFNDAVLLWKSALASGGSNASIFKLVHMSISELEKED